MFTHEEIWQALDRLAAAHGYSPSGLAKKAGLDPTTFNKSKRLSADGKPRWPSTESISKVLAVTGATMAELLSFAGDGTQNTIAVLAVDKAADAGHFDSDGLPKGTGWDSIAFPAPAAGQTYALQISDGSMAPHYSEGDILIVEPGAEIRRGDRVVVKSKQGPVIIRQLVRRTAENVELQPFDSSRDNETLPLDQLDWIARIIWASQ